MEIRSCTCNQLPFLYVDLQSQGGVSYLNDSSVFPAERDHKIIISFIKIKITMIPNGECKILLHWKAQSLSPPAKPNYSQRETQIQLMFGENGTRRTTNWDYRDGIASCALVFDAMSDGEDGEDRQKQPRRGLRHLPRFQSRIQVRWFWRRLSYNETVK